MAIVLVVFSRSPGLKEQPSEVALGLSLTTESWAEKQISHEKT
jgi:hypothetical protein